MIMQQLKKRLQKFRDDESGQVSIEALLTLPILIWTMVAIFVYYDVFHTINSVQKAAYSIADLVSRQEVVTESFIAGQENILAFLTAGSPLATMRITSLEYDEPNAEYDLLFSRTSDPSVQQHTDASLQDLDDLIPVLSDGESVVIVETWVQHTPRFDTGVLGVAPGVDGGTYVQFVVTRARNRRVCLEGTSTCVG
jgi:Flp pilus assembly protein TadG